MFANYTWILQIRTKKAKERRYVAASFNKKTLSLSFKSTHQTPFKKSPILTFSLSLKTHLLRKYHNLFVIS